MGFSATRDAEVVKPFPQSGKEKHKVGQRNMKGNLSSGQGSAHRVSLHPLHDRLSSTAERFSRLPGDEILHQIDVVHGGLGLGHVSESGKTPKKRGAEKVSAMPLYLITNHPSGHRTRCCCCQNRQARISCFLVHSLHLSPPSQSLDDRGPIEILQLAPHRKAACQTRHPRTQRANHPFQIHRGRLSLDARIRGHNHLLHHPTRRPDPLQERRHVDLVRTDAIQGRKPATKHMVQTPVYSCPLDRPDFVRLLNHADRGLVSIRIRTNLASCRLRKIPAHLTRTDLLGHLANRRSEAEGLLPRSLQEVVPKTLSGFGPHARKS